MLVLADADLVDRDNIGMLQAGGRRSFDPKTPYKFLARVLSEKQQFYRNEALEAVLSSFINNAHSAPGNLLQEFIVSELNGKSAITGSGVVRHILCCVG